MNNEITTEKLKLINGNKQQYEIGLPKLYIIGYINDTALRHIEENTGLRFTQSHGENYEAQPTHSSQIVGLFLTYNFKTQYHNNLSNENTLFLKSDHHIGFSVDSICFDCIKHNRIIANDVKQGDRLSC